jgi:hypothetical protein
MDTTHNDPDQCSDGPDPSAVGRQFFAEYIRNNPFKAYMGTGETDIIQVKRDLSKKKGDSLTYALVNRFTGSANDGTSKLEGNEEAGQVPLPQADRRSPP